MIENIFYFSMIVLLSILSVIANDWNIMMFIFFIQMILISLILFNRTSGDNNRNDKI